MHEREVVYVEDNLIVSKRVRNSCNLVYADIIYKEPNWQELWKQVYTLVAGGVFVVQTDYNSVAEVKVFLDGVERLKFLNWVIWPYDWGGRPKNAFGRKHDDILIYVDIRASHKFNAKDIQVKKVALINSTKTHKIPTDVWSDIGNFYTTSKERVKVNGKCVHWQKPLNLMERLLLAFTDKGDTVYEPYLGTGTMCVAAKSLGRSFIGCDTTSKLVSIAKSRLRKVK